MDKKIKGVIVEESLKDNRILNGLKLIDFKISDDQSHVDRWHIYTVMASEKDIEKLSQNLKPGGWYMHFWEGKDVLVIFKDKRFRLDFDDKTTWEPAIKYGLSLGIPREQLDFLIN